MPRNPTCTACSLHHFATTRCVWGHGNVNAPIMLVGEAPGANEDKEGLPFVGEAGRVLDRALSEAGLTRADCYISNIAKCRPPQNRTPTVQEADTCLPYLLEEIQQVKPKVIVCLGGAALKALTGLNAVGAARGKRLNARKRILVGDSIIMATYHPASLLYDRSHAQDLVQDLRLIRQIVRPSENREHVDCLVLPSETDDGLTPVEELLADLGKAKLLACDLEWTSASEDEMTWPWSNRGEIYSLSLTGRITPETALSVSLGWPMAPDVWAGVQELLRTKPVVFHNAMADLMWLQTTQAQVKVAGDTMILSYLLDETQDNKLETVTTHYAPHVMGGWKGHLRSTRPYTREEWEELLRYNANDTYATLVAFEGMQRRLTELDPERRESVVRLHNRLLLPSVPVLMRAAYVGVPIDETQLRQERDEAQRRMFSAGERLAVAIGATPIDAIKLATSPDKTKAYLSGSLGIEMATSRRDQLSVIVERYPTIGMILEIRKEKKLLSAYLEPWLELLARQGDSRLHTIYRPTGTRTGRLSAEAEIGGTLQTTPREGWVRKLICARPGYLIVSADYSTVELRIIAWRAPEPTMARLFQEGVDIHRATAAFIKAQRHGNVDLRLFMADLSQHVQGVTKEERQAAKGVNFGLAFGMQADKLANYARTNYGVVMTHEQAASAHYGFFRFYSALADWQQREMDDAQRLGYTETVWGRRRRFDPNDVHAAINTPIQSTASDFGLLAMTAVARRYREHNMDAEVIGFVHDSILVEVREDQAQEAARMLQETMEHPDTSPWGFTCPIPLPTEAKIGRTW